MKKLILGLSLLAIAATITFVACKKDEVKQKIVTKSKTTNALMKEEALIAVIETTTSIPMTDPGLLGCISCYNSWISDWLSTLSPEALKIVFEDYPFLEGYVIKFGQKVNGYDVSILITHNSITGEDLSLIRKTKGTLDADNKLTGEFVLAEMNGTEILHNTYVGGVRTNEINNLNVWQDNPSVLPCAAPSGSEGKFFGKCTRSQFNAAYNKAKSACEADWQCDLACSFNPCAIIYLG